MFAPEYGSFENLLKGLAKSAMALDLKKLLSMPADYPGFSLAYEKSALEVYLAALNDYLPHVQEQYRSDATRELMEQFGSEWTDDMRREKDEIDEAANHHIPRFARIGALVPIWGMFESFVFDFAEYVAKREKTSFAIRDVQASNFRERAEKYFERALRIDLPWSEDERAKLRHLQKLRDLAAHRNGRIEDLPEERRNEVNKLVAAVNGVGVKHGLVTVSSEYVREAADLVFGVLSKLEQLVLDRYHSDLGS